MMDLKEKWQVAHRKLRGKDGIFCAMVAMDNKFMKPYAVYARYWKA